MPDAQLAASQIDDEAAIRAKNADAYVEWGPLGRAFRSDLPSVVLIDEIDKVLTSHFVMKLGRSPKPRKQSFNKISVVEWLRNNSSGDRAMTNDYPPKPGTNRLRARPVTSL
ncbi:MAG: hypothetical protein KME57_01900 [Scytonema hyalinum WJT4-NPBG1]|nr:hypothetical protein [Scytonema hyalinum WJT4-NPBG1]